MRNSILNMKKSILNMKNSILNMQNLQEGQFVIETIL